MNTAYTTTQFVLFEQAKCHAYTAHGLMVASIEVGDSTVTLSGPSDVILAQLDAMRAEAGRVMAEAEGVTSVNDRPCDYCGGKAHPWRTDPWGGKPCCDACFNVIIGGDRDDPPFTCGREVT